MVVLGSSVIVFDVLVNIDGIFVNMSVGSVINELLFVSVFIMLVSRFVLKSSSVVDFIGGDVWDVLFLGVLVLDIGDFVVMCDILI